MTHDESVAHWTGEIKRQLIDLGFGPDLSCADNTHEREIMEGEYWSAAEAAIREVLDLALKDARATALKLDAAEAEHGR